MQGILKLEIVSGSGVGNGTPDFDALSERSNYRRESQSTVAGPPSCARPGVTLRRRMFRVGPIKLKHRLFWTKSTRGIGDTSKILRQTVLSKNETFTQFCFVHDRR